MFHLLSVALNLLFLLAFELVAYTKVIPEHCDKFCFAVLPLSYSAQHLTKLNRCSVFRAGCGIRLYRFLIIAFLSTLLYMKKLASVFFIRYAQVLREGMKMRGNPKMLICRPVMIFAKYKLSHFSYYSVNDYFLHITCVCTVKKGRHHPTQWHR